MASSSWSRLSSAAVEMTTPRAVPCREGQCEGLVTVDDTHLVTEHDALTGPAKHPGSRSPGTARPLKERVGEPSGQQYDCSRWQRHEQSNRDCGVHDGARIRVGLRKAPLAHLRSLSRHEWRPGEPPRENRPQREQREGPHHDGGCKRATAWRGTRTGVGEAPRSNRGPRTAEASRPATSTAVSSSGVTPTALGRGGRDTHARASGRPLASCRRSAGSRQRGRGWPPGRTS